MAYVSVAMMREATRGQFKKQYAITPQLIKDVVAEEEGLELSLRREMIQMAIDRLSWFDREVMNLYLSGWNIAEVAEATGIASGTLYQSLHRSKKFIKDAIRIRKP